MLKKFTKISKNVDLNIVLGEYVFFNQIAQNFGEVPKT